MCIELILLLLAAAFSTAVYWYYRLWEREHRKVIRVLRDYEVSE